MRTAYVIQNGNGYYLTGAGSFEKGQEKIRLFSRRSDAQNAINKRLASHNEGIYGDQLSAIPFYCYHPGTIIAIPLSTVVPCVSTSEPVR